MATREEKKQEAVERMKQIGIFPETIKQFEEEDLVSESLGPEAACYWVDEETKERIKDFEETYRALVFHVMRGKYLMGGTDVLEMETFLYVSDHPEEWEIDRDDIAGHQAFCWVNNLSWPDCSEFGSVGFKVGPAGGLIRTA